jgi:pSer/pThr/pTyr-binding forkhead associated (FHA) protein
MSAIIILILRASAAICLYAFLGFTIFIIWKDLFRKENKIENHLDETIYFNILNTDESYCFSDKEIFIGRSKTAQIQLVDDDAVSNMHSRIFSKGSSWWVEDLQSTNGTNVNGNPIVIPTTIASADQIKCGNTIIEIHFSNDPDIPVIS